MLSLDLSKITDNYTREIFRQLGAYVSKLGQNDSIEGSNIDLKIPVEVAPGVSSTHKIPVKINGKSYYLLLKEA